MAWLDFLYKYRLAILFLMLASSGVNSLRFVGEWKNFGAVITVQAFWCQGFYCYIAGRTIRLAPGGIKKDYPGAVRLLVGVGALFMYLLMFAFNGYDRGLW